MDDCHAVDLISQDIGKDMVTGRIEQGASNLLRCIGLDSLVDDSQDGKGSQLVGAQVCKMRSEARS
jgi:hypothetical protein